MFRLNNTKVRNQEKSVPLVLFCHLFLGYLHFCIHKIYRFYLYLVIPLKSNTLCIKLGSSYGNFLQVELLVILIFCTNNCWDLETTSTYGNIQLMAVLLIPNLLYMFTYTVFCGADFEVVHIVQFTYQYHLPINMFKTYSAYT